MKNLQRELRIARANTEGGGRSTAQYEEEVTILKQELEDVRKIKVERYVGKYLNTPHSQSVLVNSLLLLERMRS